MRYLLTLLLLTVSALAQPLTSHDPAFLIRAANNGLLGKWNLNATNSPDIGANLLHRDLIGTNLVATNIVSGHNSQYSGIYFNGASNFLQAPNFNGWVATETAPTGFSFGTNRTFWVGDYTSGNILNHALGGGVLSQPISVAGANELQGVAVDSTDGSFWITQYASKLVKHYSSSGVDIGDGWSVAYSPDHCAYESSSDSLWVVADNAGSGSVVVYKYSCSTGSPTLTNTVTLSASYRGDGIAVDSSNGSLWITSDQISNGTNSIVLNVSSSDGSVISTFEAPGSIEGIAVDPVDATIWLVCDAQFHQYVYGGNHVYHVTRTGVPIGSESTGLTVSAWVKPSVNNMSNNGIVARRGVGSGNFSGGTGIGSWMLAVLTSSKLFFRVNTLSGQFDVSGGTNAITNTSKWYHVCATYNGSQIVYYVDGVVDVAAVSATGTIRNEPDPIWVGGYFSTNNLFKGAISDVRIWKRALSASEVSVLYNGTL